MAEINEIIDRVITEAEVRGFDAATRAMVDLATAHTGLAAASGEVAIVTEKTDKSLLSAAAKVERHAKAHVDGYRDLRRFETVQKDVARAVEQGAVSAEWGARVIASAAEKFRLTGAAMQAVGGESGRLSGHLDDLRRRFDPAHDAAQRLSGELAALAELERSGIQITGGYMAALDALTLKYDERAQAARRVADEEARLVALGRREQAESEARSTQAGVATAFGIDRVAKPARESAAVFEADFGDAERLRAAIDPAGAALDQLNAEIARYRDLAAAGVISSGELAAGIGLAERRFTASADASGALATRLDEIRRRFDPAHDAAQRLSAELADLAELERAGVEITGGYGLALDRLTAKYDERARAAAAAADAEARMMEEARRQQSASAAQAGYGAVLGIDREAKSARWSATSFEPLLASLEEEEAMAKAAAGLRAELDPLGVAQARMNVEIGRYRQLAAAGRISTDELSRAVALAEQRYATAAAQIQRMGQSAGASGYQFTQLSYQINDMVTMAAMGADPLRILASQGGQLVQIFQMSDQPIRQQLSGMASGFVRMLGPIGLVSSAIGTLVVAGLAAQNSWRRGQDELALSLDGIGRAAGATVGQLNRVAAAGAAAGDVSTATARMAAGRFAAAGVAPETTEGLIGIAKPVSRLLGSDVKTAVGELADAFRSPLDGADALNQRLGFLDNATRTLIRSLVEQNDLHGAQSELLKALQRDLDGVTEKTQTWSRAWDSVANAASNAWSATGRVIDGVFFEEAPEQRLDYLTARRDSLRQGLNNARLPERSRARLGNELAEIDRQIAEVEKKVDEAAARAEAKAAEQRARAVSLVAGELIREARPAVAAIEDLVAKRKDLSDALKTPDLIGDATEIERSRAALEAYTGALTTYMDPAAKAAEADRLAIASIKARTVAELALVAAQRERLALAGQVMTDAERQARVAAAAAEVVARATREADDALRATSRDAALIGLTDYERAIGALNARYAEQIAAAEGAAEAVAKLNRAHALDRQGLAFDFVAGPLLSANAGLDGQIRLLEVQRESFGLSVGAVTRATEAQRLLNDYMAAGVPITAQLIAAVDAYAERAGAAAEAAEDLAYRQGRVVEMLDMTRDFSRDSLGGILKALSRGEDPLKKLADLGLQLGDRLIDAGLKDMVRTALGPDGSAEGGLLGGGLAGLLRDVAGVKDVKLPAIATQQQVAQMLVNAAAVTISGPGLAGLGGLPGLSGAPGAAGAPGVSGVPGAAGLAALERGTLSPLAAPSPRAGGIGSDAVAASLGPRFGQSAAGLSTAAGKFDYLRGAGLTAPQAAALLGNMQQESSLNPASYNAREDAFGLLNWRLDRQRNLRAMAAARGVPATDERLQLDFAVEELRRQPAGRAVLSAPDVASANAALKPFIRYGDDSEAARLGHATRFVDAFAARPAPGGLASASPASPVSLVTGPLPAASGFLPAALPKSGATIAAGTDMRIDPRLRDILDEAASRWGGKVDVVSGFRPGDRRFHGRGLAADVQLFDDAGAPLGNYQDPATFRTYERFAQVAREVQLERYPELSSDLRWGGYFAGPKGRYGALDSMHFDLAGRDVGMAGGSWEGGLNATQRALWPGATSVGMGPAANYPMAATRPGLAPLLSQAAPGVAGVSLTAPAAADPANTALAGLADSATRAGEGLGGFGDVLSRIAERGAGNGGEQPGGFRWAPGGPRPGQGGGAGTGTGTGIGAGPVDGLASQFLAGLDQGLMGIVSGVMQSGGGFVGAFGGVLQAILQGLAQQSGQGGGGLGGILGGLLKGLFGGLVGLPASPFGSAGYTPMYADGGLIGAETIRVSAGETAIPPAAAAAFLPLLTLLNGGAGSGAAVPASAAPGGHVLDLAPGGAIRGPGTGRSDSIVARAPAGTFIVNAAATARHRALLEDIVDGRIDDPIAVARLSTDPVIAAKASSLGGAAARVFRVLRPNLVSGGLANEEEEPAAADVSRLLQPRRIRGEGYGADIDAGAASPGWITERLMRGPPGEHEARGSRGVGGTGRGGGSRGLASSSRAGFASGGLVGGGSLGAAGRTSLVSGPMASAGSRARPTAPAAETARAAAGLEARAAALEAARGSLRDQVAPRGGVQYVGGDTTIVIEGNADEATLAEMRKELDARDRRIARAFEAREQERDRQAAERRYRFE